MQSDARLFPIDLPDCEWREFPVEGFEAPVSGVIFRPSRPTCCGVPLGGLGTGCLDIEVAGVLGFETLFVAFPRRPQLQLPFLGLSVDGESFVLADQRHVDGGRLPGCSEPALKPEGWEATLLHLAGVRAAKAIHYFGHYPIVDIEYEIGSPVTVGMRAWSPFVPGDTGASNIPAAVFEVRLRNTARVPKSGSLAYSFPGMPANPVLANLTPRFERTQLAAPVRGVSVSAAGGFGYLLGALGEERVRAGSELHADEGAWSRIGAELPRGGAEKSGASVAVDFTLAPGERRSIRFLLSWYAPVFLGDKVVHYTQFYAARYRDAMEVADRMAREHEALLGRVISWQEVIYREEPLPPFLRDALVNNLSLIPEASYWAFAKDPLADWAYPEGLLAMNESPPGVPPHRVHPLHVVRQPPPRLFLPPARTDDSSRLRPSPAGGWRSSIRAWPGRRSCTHEALLRAPEGPERLLFRGSRGSALDAHRGPRRTEGVLPRGQEKHELHGGDELGARRGHPLP